MSQRVNMQTASSVQPAPIGLGSSADPRGTSRPRKRTGGRRDLASSLFVAPYVLLLLAFGIGPTFYALYESLVDERTEGGGLGFQNYGRLFEDFRFWPSVAHVATFMGIWLPIMVVGVVVLALLLHEKQSKFSGAMRLIFFLPAAVTGSASVILWYFMLTPELSPFGPALNSMGFETGSDVFVSGNLPWVFAVIAFTTGAGQWIIIMFGALQNVPDDLMESARLDGCGPLRIALWIKLPLVSKYVWYMVIMSISVGLQIFVEPHLIYSVTNTAGSPWWSPNQLSYEYAFTDGDFGGAAAISVILLLVATMAAVVLIVFTDFFESEAKA